MRQGEGDETLGVFSPLHFGMDNHMSAKGNMYDQGDSRKPASWLMGPSVFDGSTQ